MSFQLTPGELDQLLGSEGKDVSKAFARLGGAKGIAEKINSDVSKGISSATVSERTETFGPNRLPSCPIKSFWSMVWEQLQDPTLILLMFAATLSIFLGVVIPEEREEKSWIEGLSLWAAVVIVCSVGASNDYSKELEFRKVDGEKDEIPVTVVRDGVDKQILSTELVVGDVVVFDVGDKVVADCVLIDGNDPKMDEANLTGETEPVDKTDDAPLCWSGTHVMEGNGKMLVIAVGPQSFWGKTMALVQTEQQETPLEEKLTVLASAIGKIGVAVAVLCFASLFIQYCFALQGFPQTPQQWIKVLDMFTLSVTLVVMAVPEGLLLAVTISLAYSMSKMVKDNNFVRVLAACETMGGATTIASDKTGTLTENRMTVVEGWFGGVKVNRAPEIDDIGEKIREQLVLACSVSSKALLIDGAGGRVDFVGNRTDCALLMMVRNWGVDYKVVRKENPVEKLYAFSSYRKMASALLKTADGYRLQNKGAAEIILQRCVSYMDSSGESVPLSESTKAELLEGVVTEMAARGLRTLCLTYGDFAADAPADEFAEPPEHDLTLLAIVGIKDPVRKEVPDAVLTCKHAGISVRMVTGDNIHTAKHIARECHILTDGTAMEGPEFRKLVSADAVADQLPQLQVLARSTPEDKYHLVSALQAGGDVVAVTGDGTNDAPALKKSDVGLSMGIAGTEVAKMASDIVILDDNFQSIIMAVMWGRNVFNNIRKFLQFQLTINFSVVLTTFIASLIRSENKPPLNILQLMWVNLIMDSFAALALATEEPTRSLLDQKPNGRKAPLISSRMWIHIVGQAAYQIAIALAFTFYVPTLEGYNYPSNCRRPCADFQSGAPTAPCIRMERPHRAALCAGAHSCPEFETCDAMFHAQVTEYETAIASVDVRINSIFFNTYIWLQLANLLNARKINDEWNILEGVARSHVFIGILVLSAAVQVLIMEVPFLNTVFQIVPITPSQWGISLGIGFSCIILSYILRIVSRIAHLGADRAEKARVAKAAEGAAKKV